MVCHVMVSQLKGVFCSYQTHKHQVFLKAVFLR